MVETGAKGDGEVVCERKFDVFQEDFEKLALDDQSINACEQAFKAYKAHKKEQSKDVPTAMECGGDSDTEQNAMEVDGEKRTRQRCCGGGCNKTQHQEHSRSDEIETTARVAAAVAGRCLGAAAAANVAAAKVACERKTERIIRRH